MPNPVITQIALTQYRLPYKDCASDLNVNGVGVFYEPGATTGGRKLVGIQILTNEGMTGEYISIAPGSCTGPYR